ncbi:MAG: alpha/beta hydrolase [Bacteroidales bacterium]|jgi:pimeloyl-ACP methyl ester carboxylesterase|nr:alpha/beta hydrolase [Bacteroidales bacterium]
MRSILFIIILATCTISTIFSQEIVGAWNGILNTGTVTLPVVFHIEETENGYLTLMDSPNQGTKGVITTSTVLKKNILIINITKYFAIFKGKVKKNTIKGTFTQMGVSYDLILTRGEIIYRRPQDPQPPYPYISEEVQFENKSADITLAGTYTYPATGNNFPVAILISGSGAQNRDEEIFNHRPFHVLADYLSRYGIGVLRYDDRGTGASQGVYHTATLEDFTSDVAAALSYLHSRKEINPQKTGLIGHSEGASIAFMLAGKDTALAFIVSMAGATIKGDSLMKLQRYFISKAMNISDKNIMENEQLVETMNVLIQQHTADSVYNYPELFVDEIIPSKVKNNASTRNAYKNELIKLASPNMQSFLRYNPTEDLQKIKCPVLAINGEKDLQVPAAINLDNFGKCITSYLTVKEYSYLNHLFQRANTGLVSEYGMIEETIAPDVIRDIASWIQQVMNDF